MKNAPRKMHAQSIIVIDVILQGNDSPRPGKWKEMVS